MSSVAVESDTDEYHSLSGHGGSISTASQGDKSSITDVDAALEPPLHPVPSMQEAFEESIRESSDGETPVHVDKDAESRRQSLLEASRYDDAWKTRWQQRPGAQHHPLQKLVAQIVFGMHLLQHQQAKSNSEVVGILQTHVNEIDGFLERTSEDFDLAITDVTERIEHLRLPMAHLDVFKFMLEDGKFRTQLQDGNDKIAIIVDRTSRAMNAALLDVQRGVETTEELAKYMSSVAFGWPKHRPDIIEVFSAMRGNEQGWHKYLKELQRKGAHLNTLLNELQTVISEMTRMAATASRKDSMVITKKPSSYDDESIMPLSPGLRSKFSPDLFSAPGISPQASLSDMNKPLPTAPLKNTPTMPRTSSMPHTALARQRHDEAQEGIATAQSFSTPKHRARMSRVSPSSASPSPQRPKTAGAHTPPQPNSSNDLAEYLKNGGPLRSHPPDHMVERRRKSSLHGSSMHSMNVPAMPGLPPMPKTRSADRPRVDSTTFEKPVLQTSTTMVFLNSPHGKSDSSASVDDVDCSMSVKSMPAGKKDSHAFARRISARMRSLPFNEDRIALSNMRKLSAPMISAPYNFQTVTDAEDIISLREEEHDDAPSQLPAFTKPRVPSIRSQSTRAPSISSVSRSKLRNLFGRSWKPREPEILA